MRVIGHLATQTSASKFSDFLVVQGIRNAVEEEGGSWAIWIHSEDEIPKAKDYLNAFQTNPRDARFNQYSARAAEIKDQELKEEQQAGKRFFDRSKIFKSTRSYGVGPVTLALIMISVAVAGVGGLSRSLENVNLDFLNHFYITSLIQDGHYIRWHPGLTEILQGQVWRLFTPMFIHGDFVHIFMNMLWLFQLGSMVEANEGSGKLVVFVLVISGLSNLAQYYATSPAFGGMSGVGYGLVGYVWMRGKFDPAPGYYLHPQVVVMMVIWYFACLVGWIPGTANAVHTVAFAVGIAWGFLASKYQSRRRA